MESLERSLLCFVLTWAIFLVAFECWASTSDPVCRIGDKDCQANREEESLKYTQSTPAPKTTTTVAMVTRVAIIPGNGGSEGDDMAMYNWYGWARDKLNQIDGVEGVIKNMPDPGLARERFWIPFMHDELNIDEDTVIIGHSSGAIAAMRYAEKYKVKGIILVSGYITHMGKSYEKESGYFDRPWQWEAIKKNAGFIVQFGSTDDHAVPFEPEQMPVHKNLNTDLRKYTDKGHFVISTFPDLIKAVKQYLKK